MALVGVQDRIGSLYFDAVFKTDHTSKVTVTEHPVEVGANINDHAYMNPNEVSMEVGVSDSAVGTGGYRGGGGRSVSAYGSLRKVQERREPITVVTRLKTYRNMMIESIIVSDDFTTMNAMKATVFMREVILVQTNTVKVSTRGGADAQKAGETNGGTKQPQGGSSSGNQSVLSQAASKLGLTA